MEKEVVKKKLGDIHKMLKLPSLNECSNNTETVFDKIILYFIRREKYYNVSKILFLL